MSTTRRKDEYEKDVRRETSMRPVYKYAFLSQFLYTLSSTWMLVDIQCSTW